MTIVGYAYDADTHCVVCAHHTFPPKPGNHGKIFGATDHEGNPVRPIFDTDEGAAEDHCGDCGSALI